MEKEKRKAAAFFILGCSMNALSITQRNSTLKTIFIFAGIAFLIIAAVRFAKLRNEKNKEI